MLIVIGVALFMYKDGKSDGSGFSFGSGEMLLLTSLTLGGYPARLVVDFLKIDLINRARLVFSKRVKILRNSQTMQPSLLKSY